MNYPDPALYNRLRDEVLYLHSLWNQAPHTSSPSPNPNPSPAPNHLSPKPSIELKNHRILKKKKKKKKPPVIPEKEWPTNPAPNPNPVVTKGWSVPPPKPAPPPPSADNVAAAAASQAQRNAVEECRSFFFSTKLIDEEGDESDDIEEDDEEDEEGAEEANRFFLEVFKKDVDLRRYYEENHEKGVFVCLVCEGSGVKKGRTFGDCIGLVQHCRNVSKTGWRSAHRALTRALCRVIGWNFERLPLFVLDVGETLGQALAREASRLQCRKKHRKLKKFTMKLINNIALGHVAFTCEEACRFI